MNQTKFRQRAVIAAMQGILSNSGGAIQANSMNGWGLVNTDPEAISILAHDIAEALLAEEIKRYGEEATEYEKRAALSQQRAAATPYDWLPWKGGECPVDGDTVVEVELMDGIIGKDKADFLIWEHEQGQWDIIRYRVVGETNE